MKNKDTLARLLARENILIKHSAKGQLAFDPKKRILTLPVFKDDLDENTYDLLVGTGVGQALYGASSKQLVDDSLPKISKNSKQAKKVLSVMEGIRTEKLVRGKYPGLSRIFNEAYQEMLKGLRLANTNMDELNILDRLNLSFKMGAASQVPFKKEEQKLVDLTAKLKTFGDSVVASRELLKFIEEEQDPPPCASPPEENDDPEQEENADPLYGEGESKKSDKKPDHDNEDDSKGEGQDDNKDEQDEKKEDNKDQDKKKDDKQDKSESKNDKQDDKKDQEKDKGDQDGEGQDKPDQDKKEEDKEDQGKGKKDQDEKSDDKDDNKDQDQKGKGKDDKKDEQEGDKPEQDKKDDGDDQGSDQQNGDEGGDSTGEDESPASPGGSESGSDDNDDDSEEDEDVNQQPMSAEPANGDAELDGPDISAMLNAHMQELIDDKAVTPIVAYMPDALDPDNYIIDYKQFFKICADQWPDGNVKAARDWMRESDMTVSHMVQEFERKKRAALYVRRRTAKTGVIDTNKLVHAMYSDDVFKRNTTVPEGKNHGMTSFLDWSGSMDSITPGTIDQLLNLVLFCRRGRIAHESYLFTDQSSSALKVRKPRTNSFKTNEIFPVSHTKLIEVFSDRMTQSEFLQAVTYLWHIKQEFMNDASNRYFKGRTGLPDALQQSSTPLDSTLLISAYINDRMRARSKLEVVKTCVITDGASNAGMEMVNEYGTSSKLDAAETIQDRRSGTILKADGTIAATGMMVELAAKRSNADYFGFYLLNPGAVNMVPSLIRKYKLEVDMKLDPVKEFNKNKYLVAKNFGFKEYYIMNPTTISRHTATKESDVSAMLRKRAQDRVLLNRFIAQIADTN